MVREVSQLRLCLWSALNVLVKCIELAFCLLRIEKDTTGNAGNDIVAAINQTPSKRDGNGRGPRSDEPDTRLVVVWLGLRLGGRACALFTAHHAVMPGIRIIMSGKAGHSYRGNSKMTTISSKEQHLLRMKEW